MIYNNIWYNIKDVFKDIKVGMVVATNSHGNQPFINANDYSELVEGVVGYKSDNYFIILHNDTSHDGNDNVCSGHYYKGRHYPYTWAIDHNSTGRVQIRSGVSRCIHPLLPKTLNQFYEKI